MRPILFIFLAFLCMEHGFAQVGLQSTKSINYQGESVYGMIGEQGIFSESLLLGLNFVNTYDGNPVTGVNVLGLQNDGFGNVAIGRTESGLGSKLTDGRLIVQALADTLPDIRLVDHARIYAEQDYTIHLDVLGTGNRSFVVTAGEYLGGVIGNFPLFKVDENGDALVLGDLTVIGNIAAANFPDYVFHPDYPLPHLLDLKKQIRSLGHLPKIPSAEEVASTGLQVGDMSIRLLEKIEELTLYVIDLQEQILEAKQENDTLSVRLEDLESKN